MRDQASLARDIDRRSVVWPLVQGGEDRSVRSEGVECGESLAPGVRSDERESSARPAHLSFMKRWSH